MATGPISFVGGVGGLGPQRIGTGRSIPSAISRYFRRNEGTTDYYSHAPATVDRIVMDVYPDTGNGNTGLPTGAPAVTDNVLQTIDFAYSGTISELCRNGASYFSGIMASVEYYFGGQLIHKYDIKSGSSNIPDLVGSNDATVINGNAEDWALYTQQETGEWLGQNNQSIADDPLTSAPIGGPAVSVYNVATIVLGRTYRIGTTVSGYQGTDTVGFSNSGGTGTSARRSSDGTIVHTFTSSVSATSALLTRSSNQCIFSDTFFKEVLNVA